MTPNVEPSATSSSALQNISANIAGSEQHGGPRWTEARLEQIDQRGEAERAHPLGEEHAAEDQTEAETDAALQSGRDARSIDAFGRAEEVPAVDPRGGHGERRQPQRHGAARDNEVRRGAIRVFTSGEPPYAEKRGIEQDDCQHAGAPDTTPDTVTRSAVSQAARAAAASVGCSLGNSRPMMRTGTSRPANGSGVRITRVPSCRIV